MDITKEEASRMKECLSGIIDWRRQSGHLLHKLIDVQGNGLITVLAGWCEYTAMEDLGKMKPDFFKTFLELPNGIPDEKTFARVFASINPTEPAACLGKWLMEIRKAGGRMASGQSFTQAISNTIQDPAALTNIAVSTVTGALTAGVSSLLTASATQAGKAAHIVSAWVGAKNLVLGQLATDEKSNEITAIPELLDMLEVAVDTITHDNDLGNGMSEGYSGEDTGERGGLRAVCEREAT